jgi:hypothetical protein
MSSTEAWSHMPSLAAVDADMVRIVDMGQPGAFAFLAKPERFPVKACPGLDPG